MNISFIGGGNMATALIGGLVSKGADAREFRVVEPLAAQHASLVERFAGIGIFGEATAGAVDGADLVVMAVKPQHMHEAALALKRVAQFGRGLEARQVAGDHRAHEPLHLARGEEGAETAEHSQEQHDHHQRRDAAAVIHRHSGLSAPATFAHGGAVHPPDPGVRRRLTAGGGAAA